MKLYSIPRRTYRAILITAKRGEIVLVPDKAFARETGAREWQFNGVFQRETTWTVRDEKGRDVFSYNVAALAYDRTRLLFLTTQFARVNGKQECEERGLRWTP